MKSSATSSPNTHTRLAGILYLVIAVFGAFSIGYVPAQIFVAGDAAKTANNIAENLDLFRLGILADILLIIFEVVLTILLMRLLTPVSKTLVLIATHARMAMIIIMGLNLINYLVPLVLLGGAEYLDVFETAQLQSLAMLFWEAHEFGVYVWQVFFALHLLPIGYLVIKSGYLPKFLGLLMLVGSFGYLLQGLEKLTLTSNAALSMIVVGLLTIVTIGELGFAFWLLIKGVNISKWNEATK